MSGYREFVDTTFEQPVRGFLHSATGAEVAVLVLTHSAGGNCQAPLLVAVADAFQAAGVTVLRCDLPFRQERATGPPMRSAERDQAGLRAAVRAMRRENPAARIWLGGHSYGGRMASMLAATEPELVEALLLLSYPLHPPKQSQQMRTQHFPQLETPALFVSGVRDGFGAIAELEAALRLILAPTKLLPVEGAGHELMNKRNRGELPGKVVEAWMGFTA